MQIAPLLRVGRGVTARIGGEAFTSCICLAVWAEGKKTMYRRQGREIDF